MALSEYHMLTVVYHTHSEGVWVYHGPWSLLTPRKFSSTAWFIVLRHQLNTIVRFIQCLMAREDLSFSGSPLYHTMS